MRKILAVLTGLCLLVGSAVPATGLIGYVNRQTLVVYEEVQPGDEVEIRALFDGQESEYHIVVNSKGGHAFVGLSIVNHINDLKESGAHITTEVSGTAMSAAAIIWLTGDVRIVHKNDMLMFHGARMVNQYNQPIPEEQMTEDVKKVIGTINAGMEAELAKIVGEKKAKKMIEDETFMTGQEAFELGIATTLK
jgi:ATP-dependent protease ClpP protease subunit